MGTIHVKFAGLVLAASLLGGCAGGGSHYTQTAPGHPVANQALADEVYLDGTGPSARRAGSASGYGVETRQHVVDTGGVTRPVVRSRPTAIPRERADDISASTTGSRSSGGTMKPFSDEWWEKERAEDARLKARMNICRGC